MTFPLPSDLNTYQGTILKKIESTTEVLNVDFHVTELYGDKDNPCSVNVRAKLKELTFQKNSNLSCIQSYAFFKCSLLSSIDFSVCSELCSIGDYAFSECTSLSRVVFPTTKLSSIGGYSFNKCALKEVFVPKCVETLKSAAFHNCNQLSEFTLESNSSITSLYKYLFYSSMVASFCVTKNVKSITSGAFENSMYLKTITVEDGNQCFAMHEGVLTNNKKTLLIAFPLGREGDYSVPNGIESIQGLSFYQSKITSITFPETLREIQGYSCARSLNLREVIIPDSVTSVGVNAFWCCSSLQTIKFSSKCTTIGAYAFSSCNITEITIPEGVTTLGNGCFAGNKYLQKVILPSTIKDIGGNAFPNNKNINISFGADSNLMIDSDLIITDKSKTAIIQYMGSSANFSPTLEKTISVIKASAFSSKSNLVGIIFPDDSELKTIESSAFSNCYNLNAIAFPEKLESISGSAFYGCRSLSSVEFKSNLSNIGQSSFLSCKSLVTIDLQNTKLETISASSFKDCTALTTVKLPANAIYFKESCFYNCNSLTSLVIPDEASIREIKEFAFYSTSIDSFHFTESSTITEIERYAFESCTKLKSFDFCDSLQIIGAYAFSKSGLTSVKLSPGVSLIKDRCFFQCSSLVSFEIPKGSQLCESGLETGAFGSCESLSTITCNSDNFAVSNKALFSHDFSKIILFPSASKTRFFPVPESVTSIGNGAFIGCTNLISVIFSQDSIRSIGNSAFEGCKNLHYINIPESITVVGEGAFNGCRSLICGVDIESKDQAFIRSLITKGKLPSKALRKCGEISCKIRKSRSSSISYLTVVCLMLVS